MTVFLQSAGTKAEAVRLAGTYERSLAAMGLSGVWTVTIARNFWYGGGWKVCLARPSNTCPDDGLLS